MAKRIGYKKLKEKEIQAIENEITLLLHASRDCLRNHKRDTKVISFSVHDAYYAEAFGVLRGIQVMGYGYFGPVNLNGIEDHNRGSMEIHNLSWWFRRLEDAVLKEENFGGTNVCEHCKKKYGKDASTATVEK